MTPTREPFRVTKWYLDCISPDGRTAIAYWVILDWRGLALNWHSVDLFEPSGERVHRWSVSSVPRPIEQPDSIAWRSRPVGCAVTIQPRTAPLSERLLDTPEGTVTWRCVAPVGHASFDIGQHAPVRGTGYAECLELTLPPWKMPVSELRWGRWGNAESGRSLVWIDWRGAMPRTWAWLDGRAVPGVTVSDTAVTLPDATLTLTQDRTLVHRALGDLVDPIPALGSMLPESLLALAETKWVGRGILGNGSGGPVTAPALFETVRMGIAT